MSDDVEKYYKNLTITGNDVVASKATGEQTPPESHADNLGVDFKIIDGNVLAYFDRQFRYLKLTPKCAYDLGAMMQRVALDAGYWPY